MISCELIFWRHGNCEDEGVLRGKTDSAPEPSAIQAIAERAANMPVPHAIFSSPRRRCLELAEAMALPLGQAVQLQPGLAEMDFGDWDGRKLAELWQHEPMEAWWQDPWCQNAKNQLPPNGETMQAFEARVDEVIGQILCDVQDGERLWLVTHGGVIRRTMASILGADGVAGFYNRLEIPYGACVRTRWFATAQGWQGQVIWQNMELQP